MRAGPIVSAGAVVGLAVVGDSLLYAVLPSHYAAFGVPVELVGLILSANRLVRIVFNPLAGHLFARFGSHLPLFAGSVGATLTTGAMAFLPGLWPLLAIRVLWGGCWSLLRLGGYVAVVRWAGNRRGRALGLFWTLVRLGMLLGGFGGAILVDTVGVRWTLIVLTGLSAFAMLLAARHGDGQWRPKPDEPAASHAGRSWWRDPPEIALSACATIQAFAIQGLVFATLGLVLLERFGERIPVNGLVLGVATVTGAFLGLQRITELFLGPVFGQAADTYGRGRIFLGGVAVASVAALVLVNTYDLLVLAVAVTAFWVGAAATVIGLDASTADLAHARDGAPLLARYATWLDVGSAAGPVVGYAIATQWGTSTLYTGTVALLLLAGVTYQAGYARRAVGSR